MAAALHAEVANPIERLVLILIGNSYPSGLRGDHEESARDALAARALLSREAFDNTVELLARDGLLDDELSVTLP